jgi:outer membrane protein
MELNLAQAVRLALDNDSRIYSSHWQTEAARHAAALAWRGSLPQVTASSTFGRQRIDYGGGSTVSGRANTRNSGLDVNWTVFEFGAGRHRIAAAKDREASATLREARTRDIAIFDVAIAYFDLYRLRHLLTINQRNRIAHRELTRVVQARVEQKQAAYVRLKEAVLRLQDIELEREDLLAQEKDAAESYRLVVGELPADFLLEPAGPAKLPVFTVGDIDHLITLAEACHPELASIRKDIDAQSHDIEVTRRQHFPTVSLYGGYHQVHNDLSNAAGPNFTDSQVGVRVSMPLFGQMVNQQVNNVVATREAQIGQYSRLLREVQRNVRVSVDTILSLEARRDQLADNARSAKELAQLQDRQFRTQSMGDDAVLAMSNALHQRFRSEAANFNSVLKSRLTAYSLQAAIGALEMEFVDRGEQFTDLTARANLAMSVPRSSDWYWRIERERYDKLPLATPKNGLADEPDCYLCGERYPLLH